LNGTKGHHDTDLEILEMQGLDGGTVLLVIKEKVHGSEGTRIYGFILDYNTLKVSLCESIVSQGLLYLKGGIQQWMPREMHVQ